jgi:cytochrome P450
MSPQLHQGAIPARCPFGHPPARKAVHPDDAPAPALEVRGDRWTVRSFALARAILRDPEATRQAGFGAQTLERADTRLRPPILYQEGAEHKAQRTATARFFTPQTVGRDYRRLMEELSDRLVGELEARREAELSRLSMQLAVRVAAQVVGLTNSSVQGMSRRLDTFFEDDPTALSWRPAKLWRFLRTQSAMWRFFYRDVKPAIRARRRAPSDDVISHLLGKGYGDLEILTECVTYAAAGMATTREFIVMAAWHLLDDAALRGAYLDADDAERGRILGEILRLEPVVGRLHRRSVKALTLRYGDETVTVPAGAHLEFDLRAINADAEVVGAAPLQLWPGRSLARGVGDAAMSFGDGHHRCPGAYLALQESDIFLNRLLRLPLEVASPPTLRWNRVVEGYELTGLRLRVR